jgi:putative transposase
MKPRSSKRYRALVVRIRGFITSEINRVLNRLVAVKAPMKLVLARITFRGQGLSRRLNRILANCGRSVLATKLKSLEQ